jgi:signal transduction histidine kinase
MKLRQASQCCIGAGNREQEGPMHSAEGQHRGLGMLPEVLARPMRHRPPGQMSFRHWMILLAVLVPPPLIISLADHLATSHRMLHQPLAHLLLETFCALIALVVFYVLRQSWCHYGGRRLAVMAHGFLVYGMLNLGHALSPHHSHSFVFLHSMAGCALAVLLLISAVEERVDTAAPDRDARRSVTLFYLAVGFLVIAAGVMFAEYVPWRRVDGSFTIVACGVNLCSAVMFAIVGYVLLQDFRRSREPIVFGFGLCALAFAEAHALFPLSSLWDIAWWGWHFVKLCIFLGLVLGIAYESVQTLDDTIRAHAALENSIKAIAERNRELSEAYDRLAATQSSLVRAERLAALGQMAGVIAHEIRNPLAIIVNCLGLMKRPAITAEESLRALKMIENNTDQIGRIVNQTLADTRAHVVRRQPVALAAVVHQVLSGISETGLGRIQIRKSIPDDLPYIDSSPQQLQQVIWNLIDNAAEAMGREGIVELAASVEGENVVVRVSDRGPGIPEGIRERIFEPLFTTKPLGTGLGLAIVRHIVCEHGGTIEVEHSSERGTTIVLRLAALITCASADILTAAE